EETHFARDQGTRGRRGGSGAGRSDLKPKKMEGPRFAVGLNFLEKALLAVCGRMRGDEVLRLGHSASLRMTTLQVLYLFVTQRFDRIEVRCFPCWINPEH